MPQTIPSITRLVGRSLKRLPVLGAAVSALRPAGPPLSPAEVGQFHEQGFLIFDPGVPEPVLDEAVRSILPRKECNEELHHGSRVFDGWKDYPAIKTIATAPRVLAALQQLYYRKPLPFQTLNFPIGTEQMVHSDDIHFSSDPPTYMCGVWTALEDIDMQNGPLVYYPGSHRFPFVSMEQIAPGPGPEHYHLYEKYVASFVAEKKLVPHYAVMKKGQALIWAANLLHGGSVHRDKGRTRHSQVTHYFFEGCQYYTPLCSYGGYRHLRDPEWIR